MSTQNSKLKVPKKHEKNIKPKKNRGKNSKSRAKSSRKLNSESQNLVVEPFLSPVTVAASTDENPLEKNEEKSSAEQQEFDNVKKSAGKAFQKKLECEGKLEKVHKDFENEWTDCKYLNLANFHVFLSYVNPRPAIKVLMQVFCMICNVPPDVTFDETHHKIMDFWRPGKAFFRKVLLDPLRNRFVEVSPAHVKMIRETFYDENEEYIQSISERTAGLAAYVICVGRHTEIRNAIKTTEVELKSAETELKLALDRWKEIETQKSVKQLEKSKEDS